MLLIKRHNVFLSVILTVVLFLSGCSASGPKRVNGELVFDADSLVNMADSFIKTGDYGNALRLYQRAASENPEHLRAKLGLARTYLSLGAADAAIAVYQSVLELDPTNAEANIGISQMLIKKDKPDEALEYLEQSAAQGQVVDNYRYYNIRGLAYDLKGEHEEAQLTYGTGLNSYPDNISLLNNLGLSFAIQGQYAPAIRILSKAANLDVNNKTALQNLVMAYALSGEKEAAQEMAATIMSEEEIPANFQFYDWLKSLTSQQKAQAIFLGKRTFPKSEPDVAHADVVEEGATVPKQEPIDPKKKKLMEILKQGTQPSLQADIAVPADAGAVEAPVAPTKMSDKVYRVQLGSYPLESLAIQGWERLHRKSSEILLSYSPLAREVSLEDGSVLYRLFVSEIEDKREARDICTRLQEEGVDCLVIYTDR
ncbi:tetratricopeptide repeat protein [Emcibacter sp.]|uniref:SPOR domain-containing protein n=1 Tax=Emcibacter sp. TaxID=1979954 RepID=UPI003A8FE7EE